MHAAGISGEILAWRDILHEGPVPTELPLDELSAVRAEYLAALGAGQLADLERDFRDRDDALRRFTDNDEVVLWFEWDLYDQLQLLQILDYLSRYSREHLEETKTRLTIVSFAGYLGNLPLDRFPELHAQRGEITDAMLALGRRAWRAFRDPDPRELETLLATDTSALPFLYDALVRHLEEFPSVRNGLSRSELQLLEAIAARPITFTEIFRRVATREDRIFCGDSTMAAYLERLSRGAEPLVVYPSGERIDAPRGEEDAAAFRNAQIALTEAGCAVLSGERDWIGMGDEDRWLGGARLAKGTARWRWDGTARRLVRPGGSR